MSVPDDPRPHTPPLLQQPVTDLVSHLREALARSQAIVDQAQQTLERVRETRNRLQPSRDDDQPSSHH